MRLLIEAHFFYGGFFMNAIKDFFKKIIGKIKTLQVPSEA
jgi:hypothetical protein